MLTVPPAPPGLTARARTLWKRYCEVMVKRRYLTEDGGDLLLLEKLAREWDVYLELYEDVYQGGPREGPEGVSLVKIDGTRYRNPKDIALNAVGHSVSRALVELGLTPSARVRARSAAAPGPQPTDPYAEFRVLPGGKKFGGAP